MLGGIPSPCGSQGTACPPCGRVANAGVKRGNTRLNSESARATPVAGSYGQRQANTHRHIVIVTRLRRNNGPAQNGNGSEAGTRTVGPAPALDDPGGECGPTATSNGHQERGNRSAALERPPGHRAGANRMQPSGRIASEANALGKAEGYADGGTVTRKVEVPVGVQTS